MSGVRETPVDELRVQLIRGEVAEPVRHEVSILRSVSLADLNPTMAPPPTTSHFSEIGAMLTSNSIRQQIYPVLCISSAPLSRVSISLFCFLHWIIGHAELQVQMHHLN